MRLIGGLALDAWGIPRATKDAGFAVPVGAAEKAADSLRGPATEVRPLRIGGVGVRDSQRGLRIALVDRRFHFAGLFQEAIRDARASGRTARVGGYDVSLVSLEFLLAMKLVSGEPQDEVDARRILQRQELRYADAREIVRTSPRRGQRQSPGCPGPGSPFRDFFKQKRCAPSVWYRDVFAGVACKSQG